MESVALTIAKVEILVFLYFSMSGIFWLFVVGFFCHISIFRYLTVNSLTYAFGWSAFLCRIRFCDTLVEIYFKVVNIIIIKAVLLPILLTIQLFITKTFNIYLCFSRSFNILICILFFFTIQPVHIQKLYVSLL
jgi:hypothetical protein